MTIGVSHTFGGTVVVVDMEGGTRWDLTPEMAEFAASHIDAVYSQEGVRAAMVIIETMEGRSFRFGGTDRDTAMKMAADLRRHAAAAKEMGRLTR